MTLVANYDRAGTNRFCSHILSADETKTICGIKCWDHKRDWQDTGDSDNQVGCLRCRRIVEKSAQQRVQSDLAKRDRVGATTNELGELVFIFGEDTPSR